MKKALSSIQVVVSLILVIIFIIAAYLIFQGVLKTILG